MHETLALDEWYCAVACMVWEGLDAVRTARKMLGETRPLESLPGTIRGDFCLDVGYGAARSRMRSADAAAFDSPEQQACCVVQAERLPWERLGRSSGARDRRVVRTGCTACPSHNGHGREHDPVESVAHVS